MNSALKFLLVLAAIAGVAYVGYSALSSDDRPAVGPIAGGGDSSPLGSNPVDEPVDPISSAVQPRGNGDREIVRSPIEDRPDNAADAEQGVRGRVINAFNRPVVGAKAFLFEGHGNNLFAAMMKANSGSLTPPTASAVSGDDGSFELGIRGLGDDSTWELRVIHDEYADLTRPNLTVFPEQWHDAGVIRLEQGIVVQGRVTRLETGAPIADAVVVLKPSNQTLVIGSTPGRESGITTRTDAGGNYRFMNATPGITTVAAYAVECARVELANQNVQPAAENRFDFELPPGKSIAGVVTDGMGTPLSDARAQVLALSAKNPLMIDTRTDRDGRFEALGLVDGPYQIIVTALGFSRAEAKPVLAGEERHIVLEKQGGCRVKVVSSSGQLQRSYTVTVKSYLAEQEAYGNRMDIPPMPVQSRDLDNGFFPVTGLDPGTYALEVQAGGFAKSYSQPFTVAVGAEAPELIVEVSAGGSIRGVVVDMEGNPIPNVQISTLPNDYEDNALAEMFKDMIPYKISKSRIATKRDGKFELENLAPGTYQLRFEHRRHYTVFRKDVIVEERRTTELQPVQMMRGTQVLGTVTVDGAPSAQIKVQVSAVPDPTGRTKNMFSATAVSDDEGRFEIQKRLPPGTYQASAGRQDNPFQMIVDYQQTKQEFTVGPGQQQHQMFFRITTQ